MKKVAGLLLVMVMMGVLGGCYSTACQQPPVNMKGEG
jgi:hypothetical protein